MEGEYEIQNSILFLDIQKQYLIYRDNRSVKPLGFLKVAEVESLEGEGKHNLKMFNFQ